MGIPINMFKRALAVFVLMPFLLSCASYNARISGYYDYMTSGNYTMADKALDNVRLLQKKRNHFLYLVEKGRIAQLLHQYDTSNSFFNEADNLAEDTKSNIGDIAIGTITNPMMQQYQPEAFEKFMLHYYKAINYLQLGKTEDALVEARRITIQANEQENKYGDKINRYSKDAFSFMLQGIIYESAGDMNNAFIAYRNAAETYLSVPNKSWYGVSIPKQLEYDVLRTAHINGFTDEVTRFEKLFNTTYQPSDTAKGGELLVFVEKGRVPIKKQQDLSFFLSKGLGGNFFFTDETNSMNIPFDFSAGITAEQLSSSNLRTFRIALPKYITQHAYYTNQQITINGKSIAIEKAQDINVLATETLRQRFLKELSSALSRLVVKKLVEELVRGKEEKNNTTSTSKKTSPDSTINKKSENWRSVAATALQLYNFLSEQADTRNWQSLPAEIHVARIPLQPGENKITLSLSNSYGVKDSTIIQVKNTGRLQLYHYSSLK
mgnify:CR=1 FL=1